MIPVTKAYLPDRKKLTQYIDQIYENGWLTNNGPLLQKLENRLASYLGVKNLILVANGSLALQLAYKALDLRGEVVTTPFSFAATTSTLAWEGLEPKFADIDKRSFNIDPKNIEKIITDKTTAIVPVHVFGNPCEVELISDLAKKYNLKVVYDAAHAFGVTYKGQSVLKYGDISTLSFHATKIFHTIEGGAVITENDEIAKKIRSLINFGITGPDKIEGIGTNAKMNEFEAAMGHCVLDEIEEIQQKRSKIFSTYVEELGDFCSFQAFNSHSSNNFAYAPTLLKSEKHLLEVQKSLLDGGITPRRYFYPSLDTLPYVNHGQYCGMSRDISSRILCLPIYSGLSINDQENVIKIIKGVRPC